MSPIVEPGVVHGYPRFSTPTVLQPNLVSTALGVSLSLYPLSQLMYLLARFAIGTANNISFAFALDFDSAILDWRLPTPPAR